MPEIRDRRSEEIKFLPPVKPRYKVTEMDDKKYIIDTHTGTLITTKQVKDLPKTDETVKGWVGPGTEGKSGPVDIATYLNMRS